MSGSRGASRHALWSRCSTRLGRGREGACWMSPAGRAAALPLRLRGAGVPLGLDAAVGMVAAARAR